MSFLLVALIAPGANGTVWRSDLLLSIVNPHASTVDVTFTGIGVNAVPTTPLHVTLQPGETQRLQNVIASQWGINNAIGLLTIRSTSANGIFPIVQGESYDSSNPAKRFGQSMSALTDADAAGAGHGQYLAGLRQDAGPLSGFSQAAGTRPAAFRLSGRRAALETLPPPRARRRGPPRAGAGLARRAPAGEVASRPRRPGPSRRRGDPGRRQGDPLSPG